MIVPINLTWTTDRPRPAVHAWVASSVVDTLRRYGYRVQADNEDQLVLTHSAPPAWPLALFSVWAYLLSKHRPYQVVFTFQAVDGTATRMLVIGDVPSKVADILQALA